MNRPIITSLVTEILKTANEISYSSGNVKSIGYASGKYYFISKNGLKNSFTDKNKFMVALQSAVSPHDAPKVHQVIDWMP
jgi:hypothetical protein